MTSLKQLSWLKYVIFGFSVAVEGAILMLLPRQERTSIQGLLRIVVMIMPLVVLFLVHKMWPSHAEGGPSTSRWTSFFVLFILVLVTFEFLRPSWRSLSQTESVDRIVTAGNGLLLPGFMLAIFIAAIMLRSRRKS
jgi:hypothetical protein